MSGAVRGSWESVPEGGNMARAVRFDRYGDRDVLYLADVAVPVPPAGEVVVEVRAAGINPGEAAIRTGALEAIFPAAFPSGQGSDLAGVVSSAGDGVTGFAVGDEVLGWSWRRSSHAEYVAVPVTQLIPKPANLSWAVAGSLYVVGCTAYAAVRAVNAGPADTVAGSAAARRGRQRRRPAAADEGRQGARHRVAGQSRLAHRARRHPGLLRRRDRRPAQGRRARWHRRLHRPVRTAVRAASRRPRNRTRAHRDHHRAG